MRTRQNQKRNTIPINTNESLDHLLTKVKVAYELRKQGKEFYSEAIFAKGLGRADLLSWGEEDGDIEAIEIVHTEDIKKSGKEKYPVQVRFVLTDAKVD